AGELALMACGEGWMARPKLNIVKMQGWNRGMLWQDTGLTWHRTSPNIPYSNSPAYYVATGILGGASGVDVGIGSDNPFGYAGANGIDPRTFTAACQRLHCGAAANFSPYSKSGCGGARLNIDLRTQASLTGLGVCMLGEINRMNHGATVGRMHG